MRTVSLPSVPPEVRDAEWRDLTEGEIISGRVVRLPSRGAWAGTRLFLSVGDGGVVSISAAARRGWTLIERGLMDGNVCEGDVIEITFVGWRKTADGERRYRLVCVEVLSRAPSSELGAAA